VIAFQIATRLRTPRNTEHSLVETGVPGLVESLFYTQRSVEWSTRRGFLIADVTLPSCHAGALATGLQSSWIVGRVSGGSTKGRGVLVLALFLALFLALLPFALARFVLRAFAGRWM
jgi:hypothetical protein